jgi:NitT/TauT family transport system ATP-binding protein
MEQLEDARVVPSGVHGQGEPREEGHRETRVGSAIRELATTTKILQVEKLRKLHRDHGSAKELLVFDDLSFDVREGEFVTVIGPSGCGKSTLLNVVAGIEGYDGGDVVVNGHRLRSSGPDIVMVFQEDALFPWLDVSENIEFGLKQKKLPKEERRSIVDHYLEVVGLEHFARSSIHQLSGGMKQRVAIARALALNPRILLMDEPFGALDARTRENLQRQLQDIHSVTSKTILFVTHDVREAVSLGDRVILFTHRPARIRQQYFIDLPRPRTAEDPALHSTISSILGNLKEESVQDADKRRSEV